MTSCSKTCWQPREIGFAANRLLGVQRLDHDPLAGTWHLHHVLDPVITDTGSTIPGLRLGQIRSQATWHPHGAASPDRTP